MKRKEVTMKKVLVVDDEKLIVKGLKFSLEQDDMEVDIAYDGGEAVEKIKNNNYDIVLLDIMIPVYTGIEVCQMVREFSNVPIIMLTAKGEDMDKIMGLEYGADDYITKPYNPTILLLRIAAVLKRMEGSQNTASYRDAEVNFSKGTISKGDQEMVLTKNEMIIFQLLLANREKIVSRDEIMTDLWDNDEFINDNALTVNISRLRGKLADLGYDDAIETRKKQGYRLV